MNESKCESLYAFYTFLYFPFLSSFQFRSVQSIQYSITNQTKPNPTQTQPKPKAHLFTTPCMHAIPFIFPAKKQKLHQIYKALPLPLYPLFQITSSSQSWKSNHILTSSHLRILILTNPNLSLQHHHLPISTPTPNLPPPRSNIHIPIPSSNHLPILRRFRPLQLPRRPIHHPPLPLHNNQITLSRRAMSKDGHAALGVHHVVEMRPLVLGPPFSVAG